MVEAKRQRQTMVFKKRERVAAYTVPHWETAKERRRRSLRKGPIHSILRAVEHEHLYALNGLKRLYPEIPKGKIKQIGRKIDQIFKDEIEKPEPNSVFTISNRLVAELKNAGLTKEQIESYTEMISQVAEYLRRH